MRVFFYLALFYFLLACNKAPVYQPLNIEENQFQENSKKIGKKRQEEERKLLMIWKIQEEKLGKKFEENSSGIWISYLKKQPILDVTIKENDYVEYTAQISSLKNQIIYSFDEFGIKKIILSKAIEIRAIESALLQMKKGEEVLIAAPSFLSYGLYGDEKKISAHEPLIIQLKVIEHKKSNYSKS